MNIWICSALRNSGTDPARLPSVTILLLNDTRLDPNPGCQATVRGLIDQLARLTDLPIQTRPLGDGYQYFSPLVERRKAHTPTAWDIAVTQRLGDGDFRAAIERADLVVANLEGTFHHHTVGALALGGALAAAHRLNRRVWAVNGSVEAIEPWLLESALSPCEIVAVREPCSHRWLNAQGLSSRLSTDCAFLSDAFVSRASHATSRTALYTPGVLARLPGPRSEPALAIRDMQALAARGFTPIYFQVDAEEAPIADLVRQSGWDVRRAADTPLEQFASLLRSVDLVVSGRYHVLIFGAMVGVPIVAKPSNTWKVEGVMELFGRPDAIADDTSDLDRLLAFGPPRPIERDIIDACRGRARLLADIDLAA